MNCPDGYICWYQEIPVWIGAAVVILLAILTVGMLLIFWLDSKR